MTRQTEQTISPLDISVTELSKRYGRTVALDKVSLEVRTGDLFALLGPNGAGKTTLLHILSTILPPDSGKALLAGFDVVKQPLLARQNIGMVFQEPSLDDRLTVFENLDFHGLVYGVRHAERRRRIDEMLELVELSDWRNHLVRALSSGMKRRLEIGRALLHDPAVLFLDEPTVGLDAQSRDRIWHYLRQLQRKQQITIVVTTHYIEEVEYCDQVCIIDHGSVLARGTPAELKAQHGHEVIRAVARTPAARSAMLEAYPNAVAGADDSLVIGVPDASFFDKFLASFGSHISLVAFDEPSLESVFLTLTGRELRDKAADRRERTYAFGRSGGEHTK